MTQSTEERRRMAANGVGVPIGPDDAAARAAAEALVRDDYDRCHPHDSFEDLKRRARFSKEDQGLLRDWMAVAAERMRREDAPRDVPQFRIAA